MATELSKLKTYAEKMYEDGKAWELAAETLQTAIDNKDTGDRLDKAKRELAGNKKELVRLREEVVIEKDALDAKKAQVAKLDDYLNTDYKKREQALNKELDQLKSRRHLEMEKSLDDKRKKVKQVENMLKDYQGELYRIKSEIASIRSGLPV